MLAWLKERGTEGKEKMLAELSKFKNRSFMEAIVAGCAMVAAADGDISADEKKKMLGFIDRADELKHFAKSDVISAFQKCVDGFAFDLAMGKDEALKAIRKIAGNPDQARLLVRVVCAIGAADGDFDATEQAVAREIISVLGLNAADFDL